jgi:hypothetical protein
MKAMTLPAEVVPATRVAAVAMHAGHMAVSSGAVLLACLRF